MAAPRKSDGATQKRAPSRRPNSSSPARSSSAGAPSPSATPSPSPRTKRLRRAPDDMELDRSRSRETGRNRDGERDLKGRAVERDPRDKSDRGTKDRGRDGDLKERDRDRDARDRDRDRERERDRDRGIRDRERQTRDRERDIIARERYPSREKVTDRVRSRDRDLNVDKARNSSREPEISRDRRGRQREDARSRDRRGRDRSMDPSPRDRKVKERSMDTSQRSRSVRERSMDTSPRDKRGKERSMETSPRDRRGKERSVETSPRDRRGRDRSMELSPRSRRGRDQSKENSPRIKGGRDWPLGTSPARSSIRQQTDRSPRLSPRLQRNSRHDQRITTVTSAAAHDEVEEDGRREKNSEVSPQQDDAIARMKEVEAALEANETNKEKISYEYSGKLAAETNKVKGVTLQFTEPPEARKPTTRWRLYVFKDGEPLNDPLYIHRQTFYLFGRERRVADIPTDHPSCSKQHAVIQYRLTEKEDADGLSSSKVRPYVMDLGSTNGTMLNGERLEPQRYYEMFEKDTIKFGNSSREYVLLHEHSIG